MSDQDRTSIPERFRDREGIDRAIRAGVQNALRIHKLLGYPIAVGRDGKVVIIPPEEIELDPEFDGPPKLPDDMLP